MNISRNLLYRIILEEYVAQEGVQLESLSKDKYEEFLAWIQKRGPKPEWLDDYGKSKKSVPGAPEVPPSPDQSDVTSSETYPMDIPSDDATEREYQGFQKGSSPSDMNDEDLISSISQMIQGRDPEHVAELFQAVFAQIPGVEMSPAPADPIPTEYGGEELDLRQRQGRSIGFEESIELEDLTRLIKEVMTETDWHNITAGETAMPHSTDAVEPVELIQRIQNAYHNLQDAFKELDDDLAHEMGRAIISDLETLMDVTEYPEDYRE